MSRSSKFDYQAAIESNLIAWPDGLTLDELLERSALEVDRSTLFRHLSRLIESGRAERIGKARATRYRLLGAARARSDSAPPELQPPPANDESPRVEPAAGPAASPPTPALSPDEPLPPAPPDGVPAAAQAASIFNGNYAPSPAAAARAALEDSRHGPLVIKAVRRVVRERSRFNPVNLDIYLSLLVPREELDDFTAEVKKELAELNEGNLYRFDLSPAEFSGYSPLEESSGAAEN